MQHECLFDMPDYFLRRHYDEVLKRLWTDRFIATIQRVLHARNIQVSVYRVHGATEAFLHNLKMTRRIGEKIDKLYDMLIGEDEAKIKEMNEVADFWKGKIN